jgi:tRNA A-37 threonylcarbamoyl transferase component Bud32
VATAERPRVSPKAPNLAGKTVGRRYRLLGVLGEGGFGTVYEGVDERLGRRVAVKVVKPWWAEDPEWTGRFEQEAKLAASLNHRGIVQVHDSGRDVQAGLYIVCELVEGESLADRARRARVPAPEAVRIVAEILDALQAAHERGVIHRDIKPQNVLIDHDGAVKLADFGVARLSGGMTNSSASATVIGTPVYMSPEQARGRTVKATADVYSVGVLLYELLAGEPPFTGDNHVELAMKHVSDPPPALPPKVPAALRDVVSKALAKDPSDRYASAAQMASALRAAIGDVPDPAEAPTRAIGDEPTLARVRTRRRPRPAAGPPPAAESPAPRQRRRPAILGAAVLVAGLAVTVVLAHPWSDGGDQTGSLANPPAATAADTGSDQTADNAATPDPGPPQRSVPTLRGLSLTSARSRARNHHLAVAVNRHHSRTVGEGLVISQSPRPGERVDDGATVAIHVSTGPPPVRVPDVAGAAAADAVQQLTSAGLTSTTVTRSSAKTAGTVLSQSPDAGRDVPPGTTVQLTVAALKTWRTIENFHADGEQSSDVFRVRGGNWKLTYTLTFGQCSFSCYPPSLYVHNQSGTDFESYELREGTHTTSLPMPPGRYYLETSTVSQDEFTLDVKVEDYS